MASTTLAHAQTTPWGQHRTSPHPVLTLPENLHLGFRGLFHDPQGLLPLLLFSIYT